MAIDISNGLKEGDIEIKIITCNTTSITLLTDEKFGGKVIQPDVKANRALAEHGLAMSISIKLNDTKHHFLLDTGGLNGTFIKNSENLKVNLEDIEKVILSHGHFDHFGGLMDLIPKLKDGAEIYLNPICFEQNQVVLTAKGVVIPAEELGPNLRKLEKEGKVLRTAKLPTLNKSQLFDLANQHNIKIIEINKPNKLYNGVITSGEIELFDEEEATKGIYLAKGRKELEEHTFRDETSLYINVQDKGLIVLTGCAHTGLINTIKHGQKLTGIEKIYAVIGGFHKEYESDENIRSAVEFVENLNPAVTCGMHCTGFRFNTIMMRHPSHTLGIVGTEFHL
jgi:7,8-dihydropterin-6-yl-methyl-4-(beta-D-ribofuranosyl)aminobenzene 5'-phosphate synthase